MRSMSRAKCPLVPCLSAVGNVGTRGGAGEGPGDTEAALPLQLREKQDGDEGAGLPAVTALCTQDPHTPPPRGPRARGRGCFEGIRTRVAGPWLGCHL